MDYEVGTKLLIRSPGNEWISAIVEEDDGQEIFITYTENNGVKEWINKDSNRIKPTYGEQSNKLIKMLKCPELDRKSIFNTVHQPKKKVLKKRKERFQSNRRATRMLNTIVGKNILNKKYDFSNKIARDDYVGNNISSNRRFKIEKNRSEVEILHKKKVIYCLCLTNQEDGLMIQCDFCLCWQHGVCYKIDSKYQIPDRFLCDCCLDPRTKEISKQNYFIEDWIEKGKVARRRHR